MSRQHIDAKQRCPQRQLSSPSLSAPTQYLNASIATLGHPTVLSPLRKRLIACKPITVVGIGSSITAKSGGCTDSLVTGEHDGCCGAICTSRSNGWLRSAFDQLIADFPQPMHGRHRLFNAGVPSSSPAIFVECLDTWLPEGGVDLFVVEFVAIAGLTRLMQRLAQPRGGRTPALVFVSFFRWWEPHPASHDAFVRAARDAGWPCVSQATGLEAWRSFSWTSLRQRAATDARTCADARQKSKRHATMEACWNPALQAPDGLHPAELGQIFMSDALAFLFHRSWSASERRRRGSGTGIKAPLPPLPPPPSPPPPRSWTLACYSFDARLSGGAELKQALMDSAVMRGSKSDEAAANRSLEQWMHYASSGEHRLTKERLGLDGGSAPRILSAVGWVHVLEPGGGDGSSGGNGDEVAGLRTLKAGLAGHCPGDKLRIDVSQPSDRLGELRSSAPMIPYVAIDYLRSYEHMGRVQLLCERQCGCEPTVVEGHTSERHSVRNVRYVPLEGSLLSCVLNFEIMDRSVTGEFKFKLNRISIGLMPSPPPPESPAPPSQLPPPPPACSREGIRSSAKSPTGMTKVHDIASCDSFCDKRYAPRHCLFCRCQACSFCINFDSRLHRARDIQLAANFSRRVRQPPPPPPPLPPSGPPPVPLPPSPVCRVEIPASKCGTACASGGLGGRNACTHCQCLRCILDKK